jgi:hypothetical protein
MISTTLMRLANWYQERSPPHDWAIATTKNGWTDNETGLDWLKDFNQYTIKRSSGAYRLLILEGMEATTLPTLRHIAKRKRLSHSVCLLIHRISFNP